MPLNFMLMLSVLGKEQVGTILVKEGIWITNREDHEIAKPDISEHCWQHSDQSGQQCIISLQIDKYSPACYTWSSAANIFLQNDQTSLQIDYQSPFLQKFNINLHISAEVRRHSPSYFRIIKSLDRSNIINKYIWGIKDP